MAYKRLTITFPQDLVTKVRRCVRGRGFSTFLADATREKLSRDDSEVLREKLVQGYAHASLEDRTIDNDWDNVTADGL